MSPPNPQITRLQQQGDLARMEYLRTGDLDAFFRMIAAFNEAHKLALGGPKQTAAPARQTVKVSGDRQKVNDAAQKLSALQKELEDAGDNPPPGLLAKIQIATQAYQAWFTCLKSCADSKGQVQGELSRFR
jgi:hypothetical protein